MMMCQQQCRLLFCSLAKRAGCKRGPALPSATVMGRIIWPMRANNPIRPKLPAKPLLLPRRRSPPPPPHFRTPSPVFTPAGAFRPTASLDLLAPAEPARGRRLPLSAAPRQNGFPLQQIPGGTRPCPRPFTCRDHRGISISLIRPGCRR